MGESGIVVDRESVPVYKSPTNRSILCYLSEGSEVSIDMESSTKNYYHVYLETSMDGYCSRRYVEVAY